MQAYNGKGRVWRYRNLLLGVYTDILTGFGNKGTTPLEADLCALRDIARDASLTMVERTHAQYVRADSLWTLGRQEASIKQNKKVLELAARATPAERAAPCITAFNSKMCWVLAAQMIDKDVERSTHNLIVMDPQRTKRMPPPPPVGVRMHERAVRWPVAVVEDDDPEWPGASRVLRKAFRIRSASCSQCGVADVALSCCSKCKLAFYCSGACQRANWAAHRPQCRAPGDFREGDVVMLQDIQTRRDYNGHFFLVLERDPGNIGRWRVENTALPGEPLLSIRQSCMQHVLTH